MGKTRRKAKPSMNIGGTGLVIGVLVILAAIFMMGGGGTASLIGSGDINIEAPLAATPTVTLMTPDKYNTGTAVTTQNMYRQVIAPGVYGTWVDVAGAGTISLAAGTELEYVIGIDSNDESAEPYGAHVTSYKIPRTETSTIVEYVANDATTEVTGKYYNADGDATTNEAWAVAKIETLSIKYTGSYELDFGNKNAGEMANVLVVKYNTTQVDSLDITSIVDTNGKSYPVKIATVPQIHDSASGYTAKAYAFPVIESNNGYTATYSLDGDNTVAINTSVSAITFSLYDGTYYLDKDDNTIKSGVEDEDSAEIGAAAAETITPSIGQ